MNSRKRMYRMVPNNPVLSTSWTINTNWHHQNGLTPTTIFLHRPCRCPCCVVVVCPILLFIYLVFFSFFLSSFFLKITFKLERGRKRRRNCVNYYRWNKTSGTILLAFENTPIFFFLSSFFTTIKIVAFWRYDKDNQ